MAVALDGNTEAELEGGVRLRDADAGREDTFFSRVWIHQDISNAFTLSGGVERRISRPGADETRFLQQLSGRSGVLRTRFRLEQRLVDGARLGLRLRPRFGVEFPVDKAKRFALFADGEAFVTLRSTSAGGQDGLTGLRMQVGTRYKVSDVLRLSLTYLRQQDFRDGRPDRVGHAPLIGIDFSF